MLLYLHGQGLCHEHVQKWQHLVLVGGAIKIELVVYLIDKCLKQRAIIFYHFQFLPFALMPKFHSGDFCEDGTSRQLIDKNVHFILYACAENEQIIA